MTMNRIDVLEQIAPLSDLEDYPMAKMFLQYSGTEMAGPNINGKAFWEGIVKPEDILATWKSRLWNASKKGIHLYGCAEFVDQLQSLPQQTELLSLSFRNEKMVGTFWFVKENVRPIGFVLSNLSL
jgi:hypothetical protein